MAKVAKAVAAPGSDSLRIGHTMNIRPGLKRKTPSELRGEQLKRKTTVELVNESGSPSENTGGVDSGTTKPLEPKSMRYKDKRLDQVYPTRKPNSRLAELSGKLNSKENHVIQEKSELKTSFSSHLTSKNHLELNGASVLPAKASNCVLRQCESGDEGTKNKFCSVAELSFGKDRFTELGTVDVDKALKGLAPETSGSCSPSSSDGKSGDIKSKPLDNYCSEIHIPGTKAPLDFTLKTAMRIVSSSPLDRFHRLFMDSSYNGMTSSAFKSCYSSNRRISTAPKAPASADSYNFQSWIYPQSSLPASVISVLSSSTGGAEMEFLDKRQQAWEESFRSLYYMLRKSGCNVFYVCTSQFVVIFAAVEGTGKVKRTCNAFISQSTRGLRSLLKEHDISFSMPLCFSEVEQISREDLVELSEIEKHNLGQAKRFGSTPNLDSCPSSLLAFNGNDSVHGLYDFLLNYRSLLTTLSSMDVPVLYAPVPFFNAAISSPQVKYKEIRRVESLQSKGLASKDGESIDGLKSSGICYSIDVKDTYLPPWIICSMCSAVSSEGINFEASFVTDPNTIGLNATLEAVNHKSKIDETSGDSHEDTCNFGISTALVSSSLLSGCLKALKYSNGSYLASLSPV